MKWIGWKGIGSVVALSLALVGCSGGSQTSEKPDSGETAAPTATAAAKASAAPKERQKVKVLSWWDFTQSEPLKQLKAKFEQLNPDLEMEFLQVGGAEYQDKVLAMVAGGGDLPEVMMLAMDKIPIFADKGAILPLDKYVTKEYTDSLYPVVSQALAFNGKPYAVARDITSKVMFLNKQMFDDAKVAYPDPNWTWDDFQNVTKQLTKADGSQWGFYFPKYMDGITHWLMLHGGGLSTNDGKSLIGKAESRKALQLLQDMVMKDKTVPTESQAKQFGAADTAPFIAGKVAMVAGGLSYTTSFDQNKVGYLVRPLPKVNQQISTSFVNSWVIPKGAKNPDLSWRILEFFSGKDGQQIVLDTGMGLPAIKSVDTSAFLAKNPENKVFIDSLQYSVPFPTPVHGGAFGAEVTKQFDLMWLGQKKVDDAVDAIEKVAADLLSGKK